jgi:hypothetical protein
MVRNFACVALLLALVSFKCAAEDHKHEDHKAPHGGTLLEVGEDAAHVEVVHDEKAGKVTLYILDKEAKNGVAIKDAPKLNLKTDAGNKQVDTTAVEAKDGAASKFEATNEVLKQHGLKGRIALSLDGKKYNVNLSDDHDHNHDHK